MSSYKCCSPESIAGKQIATLASTLKIVADSSKLKILCILCKGKYCVCEIMEQVDLSQSLISHHLKDLKDVKVVTDDKRGHRVYYSLTSQGIHITQKLFEIQDQL